MIRWFTAHPVVANVLMLAIIAFGITSLPKLNKESFPTLKPSKVQVRVVYPGATPADVEDGICKPLEDATDGISFLKEQVCDARDNAGIFTLEMQEAGDIRRFTDDINAALDGITNFPDDAEEPIVTQLGLVSHVVSVAITAEKLTASELKDLGEYYRSKMLAEPRIPIVEIDGFPQHQLQILLRPDMLLKYRLSVQDIARLVGGEAVDLPAGTLESDGAWWQISFDNARRSVEALEDLIVLQTDDGGEIRLGDIARVVDRFSDPEERVELNGRRSAVLKVSKNTIDDTLKVFAAVEDFVAEENRKLPPGTRLTLVQDGASLVADRLRMLVSNAWQGLLLAGFVLFLFFNWRYSVWVIAGLPISFLGGLAVMVVFGVSINMISMVALLMSIGILMDDAIVISESIAHESHKGKGPLAAAIDGTQRVLGGVFASYLTSAFLFGSLLMMKGDLGQILGVLPVVLLAVLTVSLIEAFLILPHHLYHSLAHARHSETPPWRQRFEAAFHRLRLKAVGVAEVAITYRYLTFGIALALLISSVGLIATGTVKFKAFPDIEGNSVDAQILLPQGTPLAKTETVVAELLEALEQTAAEFDERESEPLIRNVQVFYSQHAAASESGAHLATITVDLLETSRRHTTIAELTAKWRQNAGDLPGVINVRFREPKVGPAGAAIDIRLSGPDLNRLSRASWEIQNWLRGYRGVSNLLDDLRPGKPEFRIRLLPGALAAGVTSASVAAQLRAAYQEAKIDEIYRGREAYEIVARLDSDPATALEDFDDFMLFNAKGEPVPLVSVAEITPVRNYARIGRVDHERTVNIVGDVDPEVANTSEVIAGLKQGLLPALAERYPDVRVSFKGEVENGAETRGSILSGFALGLIGVYLLLTMQFRNYLEPVMVMLNIPLALIGAIWGHFLMGLDFALPSMIGFVALAGVVVNDSILLVQFVKQHVREGMTFHDAAAQAVHDRFRAIFLTSVTTVAGMIPLLLETSTQALVLIPLVTSIVFGMLTSTLLILLVLPAVYAILEDMGIADVGELETPEEEMPVTSAAH